MQTVSPLALQQFSFTYDGTTHPALRELNLTLERGEWLLVCGASGSGKSTLARAATGLVPHFYAGVTSGHVYVGGLDAHSHTVYELFRHAPLVFQNPQAQVFNSSVENEIAFGLESIGLPRSEMRERIAWASEAVGSGHLLTRAPHTLSGGEQQRVAIAAALALRPPLLMLDEPFAHLDGASAAQLRQQLKRIQRDGTTVLVIEHRLHDLVAEADRIAVVHQGALALCDWPHIVLAHDLERFGVGLPYAIRLFREHGWNFVPLTAREAAEHARGPMDAKPIGANARQRGASWLTLEHVSFARDGQTVLRGVTFDIARGESVALLGRNGAGKTTLLKMLSGLRRPLGGRIVVGGQDAAKQPPATLARRVGLVFQNANDQLFMPNVREEIELGARRLGIFDAAWCAAVIETLGLQHLLERSPFRLSEGEKKRVAMASVLTMRPNLIALDEPTVGQDHNTRQALIGLLQTLQARGHTLLIATHDLELAEMVAPRWLLLGEGRILADDTPDQIMLNDALMHAAGLAPTDRFVFERVLAARN
ncbi:MAG: ABC transporter ATP-binding protein [Chloroflexi bacterium]|nr:ABC transporter ATP-binding protein [Chloroflexota bacterium]